MDIVPSRSSIHNAPLRLIYKFENSDRGNKPIIAVLQFFPAKCGTQFFVTVVSLHPQFSDQWILLGTPNILILKEYYAWI